MGELKTKKDPRKSVRKFIDSIAHERRRHDAEIVYTLMAKLTGEKGVMWGESIVGFGDYAYTRSTGEAYNWFAVGFSPRKAALVIYSVPCVKDFKAMVAALGPVTSSVSCVYITDLAKVDLKALEKLIRASLGTKPKERGVPA